MTPTLNERTDAWLNCGETQFPTVVGLLREWRALSDALRELHAGRLHIVFDGPPCPTAGRFVECENDVGQSINAGEWAERPDGFWELVVSKLPPASRGDDAQPGGAMARILERMAEAPSATGVLVERADLQTLCNALNNPSDRQEQAAPQDYVDFYEREFYSLSNFSAFTLEWENWRFDTSEAAYHFMKFPVGLSIRQDIRLAPSAHEAFKLAEKFKWMRRDDWDDVKVEIMRKILRAKAEQHEYVRRKLLETGDRQLIECSWRDDFWGWGANRDGQNMLGKLWMEIRAELRGSPSARQEQSASEPGLPGTSAEGGPASKESPSTQLACAEAGEPRIDQPSALKRADADEPSQTAVPAMSPDRPEARPMPLDEAWAQINAQINALGGRPTHGGLYSQGYVRAIDEALAILTRLGATDAAWRK